MMQRDMTNGLRVKVAHVIDLFPIGVFVAGLTGTVCDVAHEDDEHAPPCHVLLDEPHIELGQWDNKLQVWPDGLAECTPYNFEPI